MKVESIEINNFKAISHERMALHGKNVYVLGKNAVGKTSFLDAIFKTLSGDYPQKPTQKDKERGQIKIDLGDIKVIATFNEKDEKVKIIVEAPDGKPYASPRGLLNEKCGIVDFNITEFFRWQPKEQIEFLKKLCGIDFTDVDAEYKEAFEDRTFKNRKLKEQEAIANVFFDRKKVEKKDFTSISEKLQEIDKHNERFTKVESRLADKRKELKNSIDSIAEIHEQIKELNESLIAEEATKKQLELDLIKGEKWISEEANKKKDSSLIKNEMQELEQYNQEVEENLRNKEKLTQLEQYIESAKKADERVKSIQLVKVNAISEIKLPVPGLTFDDNQLYYKDLPFKSSQINTAQQIIIGLQLNMALLKDVKIARFDGSLLDDENIALVEAWAAEHDLQLFVEFVDRNEEGLRIEVKENA